MISEKEKKVLINAVKQANNLITLIDIQTGTTENALTEATYALEAAEKHLNKIYTGE